MRRLIQIVIVALGVRAFLRWRKRRKTESEVVTEAPPTADPADELRQKLAESRTDETIEDAPVVPETKVEDRRADVHDQGRATLDEMKSSDEG